MTENQVLRLLQRIVAQKNLLKSIKAQLESLDQLIEPTAADPSKAPISGGKTEDVSKLLACIEKKRAALCKRYVMQIDNIMETETAATSLIRLIDSAEIKSILMDRYFTGKDWETICKEHHYQRARIFQLRKSGIREIAIKTKKMRPKKSRLK